MEGLRKLPPQKRFEFRHRHFRSRSCDPFAALACARFSDTMGDAYALTGLIPACMTPSHTRQPSRPPPDTAAIAAAARGPSAASPCSRSTAPQARNALSEAMIDGAARGALGAIQARDNSVRAVVIAANGPAFCAGHDLKELTARRTDADGGRGYFHQIMTSCSAMMQAIVHCPKPVIAAVRASRPRRAASWSRCCDLADRRASRREVRHVPASISACSARRRWWRCRATSRASRRWICC